MTLTPEQLAELKRLDAAATQGPWRKVQENIPYKFKPSQPQFKGEGNHVETTIATDWEHPQARAPLTVVGLAIGIGADKSGPVSFVHIDDLDAELIAAMRNALPALIAAAEREARMREAGAQQSDAARDVIAERARQVSAEGWTTGHDDIHAAGELAGAAAAYALYRSHVDPALIMGCDLVEAAWPFHPEWWKPTAPRRDLVKAAALLLAEIERLDRAALAGDA